MTAQLHEKLLYEGEATSMAFCPPLPESHPRIVVLSEEEVRDGNVDDDNRTKKHNVNALGWQHLPGRENEFEGDDL